MVQLVAVTLQVAQVSLQGIHADPFKNSVVSPHVRAHEPSVRSTKSVGHAVHWVASGPVQYLHELWHERQAHESA